MGWGCGILQEWRPWRGLLECLFCVCSKFSLICTFRLMQILSAGWQKRQCARPAHALMALISIVVYTLPLSLALHCCLCRLYSDKLDVFSDLLAAEPVVWDGLDLAERIRISEQVQPPSLPSAVLCQASGQAGFSATVARVCEAT